MADAFGTLIFSCSKDATFDSELLVDYMNMYEWETGEGLWVLDGDDIYYEGMSPQYPTVYPLEIKSITLKIDNVLTKITPSELTDDQEEFVVDREEQSVSLEEFRNTFARHITDGWIQIACIANEKKRYIYLEEMRIYFDGSATRKRKMIGSNKRYEDVDDEESLPSIALNKPKAKAKKK